jgi:nucleoside triphosphate pyrophosphatase
VTKQSHLILASQSAHRAALLRAAGLSFEICESGVNEDILKAQHTDGDLAQSLAMTLSSEKAAAVSALRSGAFVIGGDQVLVCEGRIFDKPESLDEARAHLSFLRGKTHTLETALTVCKDRACLLQIREAPRLSMWNFSDAFLDAYLESAGPDILSCVGAYQIEAEGVTLFEAIEGDTFSIQGLPLIPLLSFLRVEGLLPQ